MGYCWKNAENVFVHALFCIKHPLGRHALSIRVLLPAYFFLFHKIIKCHSRSYWLGPIVMLSKGVLLSKYSNSGNQLVWLFKVQSVFSHTSKWHCGLIMKHTNWICAACLPPLGCTPTGQETSEIKTSYSTVFPIKTFQLMSNLKRYIFSEINKNFSRVDIWILLCWVLPVFVLTWLSLFLPKQSHHRWTSH